MSKTLVDSLKWRYATNRFNTAKVISESDLSYVLTAGNLMPTSYGLQPFRIIAIVDQSTKEKLREATFGQAHAIDNGALIVLAVRTDIDEAMITEYAARIEKTRDLQEGAASGFKKMIVDDIVARTPEEKLVWAQKQAYIALGGMIAAASELGIDNHGLEGFNAAAYNEILGLSEKNLHATVLLALGYRAENDESQNHAKVRVPPEEMIIRI